MLGGQMSGVKCRPPYIILSSFLLQWTMTFIPWKLSIIHAIDLNSKLYSNVYIGKLDPWHPPFMKSLKYGIQLWITPVPRYSKFTFDTPAARSVLKFRGGGRGHAGTRNRTFPVFGKMGMGWLMAKMNPPTPSFHIRTRSYRTTIQASRIARIIEPCSPQKSKLCWMIPWLEIAFYRYISDHIFKITKCSILPCFSFGKGCSTRIK